MKKNTIRTGVTLAVIFFVTCFFVVAIVRQGSLLSVEVPESPVQIPEQIKSAPINITIERLGITVPVTPGEYDAAQKTWTLSWDSASFANMTALPNAVSGKTIIYGHNTKKIFGRTKDIRLGDIAIVATKDGSQYTYMFVKEDVVTPETTDVFRGVKEGSPQLVLLTCGGFLNEKRRILYFDLVGVEHLAPHDG